MPSYTVYFYSCSYYDYTNQVCNNPHGPYGEDCDWGKEDEEKRRKYLIISVSDIKNGVIMSRMDRAEK